MRNFLSSISFGLFLFMMGCCASPVKVLVPEPVPHQVYRDDQIERVKRLKNITVALMGESNEHQVISCKALSSARPLIWAPWPNQAESKR